MINEKMKNSIRTKELKLGLWKKIYHFPIVIYLLIGPSTLFFFHLKTYIFGTPKPFREWEVRLIIVFSILALMFYLLQKNRLKFKSVDTTLTREELNPIIGKVANELEWTLHQNSKKMMTFKSNPRLWSGSWGEQITILFYKNRVLVNSICDLEKQNSVASYGRNKENMAKLIEEIKKANL